MSKAVLKAVDDAMQEIGINYEFKRWHGKPIYPYFTGEYQEIEPLNEDGMHETQFILNGFARGDDADDQLETARQIIEEYFPSDDGRLVTTDTGSVVAIFYASAFNNLPEGDAEIDRLQINLIIKEWRGKQ